MLLITITRWREKFGLVIRLILFLVLIGLILPRFLNYLAGAITDLKGSPDGKTPPGLRVEEGLPWARQEKSLDREFLEKLEGFYHSPKIQESNPR